METLSDASKSGRNTKLDALRGLAVALMVVDHVLAATETVVITGTWGGIVTLTRLTLTRVAMPLFMLVSGYTLARYGTRKRRIVEAVLAATVVNIMWFTADMGTVPPDILVMWVAAAATFAWWSRFPVPVMIASYIQMTYWEVPWGGYQPGQIFLFMAAGTIIAKTAFESPDFKEFSSPLEFLGRHPLSFYVGHVAAIWAIVTAANLF